MRCQIVHHLSVDTILQPHLPTQMKEFCSLKQSKAVQICKDWRAVAKSMGLRLWVVIAAWTRIIFCYSLSCMLRICKEDFVNQFPQQTTNSLGTLPSLNQRKKLRILRMTDLQNSAVSQLVGVEVVTNL